MGNGLIAGLDVGTTKVCCFVARFDNGLVRVIGIGNQVSRGLRAGAIIDMDEAEESIRNAVDAAERMAREPVRETYVNLSGGFPASHTVGVEMSVAGRSVGATGRSRPAPESRIAW